LRSSAAPSQSRERNLPQLPMGSASLPHATPSLGVVTPPTSSAERAVDALQSRDPLATDADPEEIMRHLQAIQPPQAPPFNVKRQGQQPQPQPQPIPMPAPPPPLPLQRQSYDQVTSAMQVIQTARTLGAMMATRVLLLLGLLFAGAAWAFTVYDPAPYRIAAAAIFSAMVVWPLVVLALRKG
jgi:hypothetical protein